VRNPSKSCQIFVNPVHFCAFCVKKLAIYCKKFSVTKTPRHEVNLDNLGEIGNRDKRPRDRNDTRKDGREDFLDTGLHCFKASQTITLSIWSMA
jgi:hypothetical protein